jgi:cytochrome c-type biogenesis protein CcmH
MRKFSILACLLILTALSVGVAHAQGNPSRPPTDDEVNAVAKQLYCPVCENIPLDVCPTQACAEWRDLIRQKLAVGWTPNQIKRYFADQYGDRVLGVPPARGLNWLVYLIPPVAILAGIYLLVRAFRSWKLAAPASANPTDAPILGPDGQSAANRDVYAARLEEELKKLP